MDSPGILVVDKAPDKVAKQYTAANYLLDVRTVNWGFSYFPMDWNSYAVTMGSRLRVIDTSNAKVVAESLCYRKLEKTDSAPSSDDLLANQAQRLKEELRNLADYCIREFKANALKLCMSGWCGTAQLAAQDPVMQARIRSSASFCSTSARFIARIPASS